MEPNFDYSFIDTVLSAKNHAVTLPSIRLDIEIVTYIRGEIRYYDASTANKVWAVSRTFPACQQLSPRVIFDITQSIIEELDALRSMQ